MSAAMSILRNSLRRPMEDYKGRGCACAPGTHEAIVRVLDHHVADKGASVLDIGAHAGALLMRFKDCGFNDLTGSDLDGTRFDVPGGTFKRVELNGAFAGEFGRQFDIITCTDVIEHLDSPRNFMIEARKLLKPNGWLAISMPNIAFWEGRVKFALNGELWGFGERNYKLQRHISPMTRSQLTLTLQELGFKPVHVETAGSFSTVWRDLLFAAPRAVFRAVGGKNVLGECLIAIAQRHEPDEDLARPVHYRERWAGKADGIGLEHLVGQQ
jgi:SAM-dependent methyltransferase